MNWKILTHDKLLGTAALGTLAFAGVAAYSKALNESYASTGAIAIIFGSVGLVLLLMDILEGRKTHLEKEHTGNGA